MGLFFCLLGLCSGFGQQVAGTTSGASSDIQGYLYVQPFGARVEVLFRAPLMLQWLGITMDADATVTAEDQKKIRTATTQTVADWCSVTVDGVPMTGALTAVAFFKGTPMKSATILPTDALSVNELLVGLVWEFPLPAGPEQIDVKWTKFQPPLEVIPVQIFFGRETEAQVYFLLGSLGLLRFLAKPL